MKNLLTIFLLLTFGISNSQNFIDGVISCSNHSADEKLRLAVGKRTFNDSFKFDKSKTLIEVYNENEKKLERLTLDEYRRSGYPATQIWLNYGVLDENLVLTELLFPFNLNCTTPWDLRKTKEIIEPYKRVLENRTNVGLKEALQTARQNSLNQDWSWDIDFEGRKLVWTFKSTVENDQVEVIRIDSKNGKILSEIIEVPID